MATIASDIYIRSGASGSFTAIEYVQGAWITVPSASNMFSIYEDRLKDGQIVYIQQENKLYSVTKFTAFETPGYAGLENSASFEPFGFPSASSALTASYIDPAFISANLYTGSFAITGSNLFLGQQTISSSADNIFLIKNAINEPILTVSQSGVIVLATQSVELSSPAPVGGMYFTSSSFFIGLE